MINNFDELMRPVFSRKLINRLQRFHSDLSIPSKEDHGKRKCRGKCLKTTVDNYFGNVCRQREDVRSPLINQLGENAFLARFRARN